MKRFDHKYTINGYLEAQTIGSAMTAKEVKDYLYKMIFVTRGDILMNWRTQHDDDYHPTSVIKNTTHDSDYVHCYFFSARFLDNSQRGQSTDDSPNRYELTLVLGRGLTR